MSKTAKKISLLLGGIMWKKIFVIGIVFLMVFTMCFVFGSCKKEPCIYGDFIYSLIYINNNGEQVKRGEGEPFIRIDGLSEEGKGKEVIVVPETIDGCQVKYIGYRLFWGHGGDWESDRLKKVYIPCAADIIHVFTTAPNLEKVIIFAHEEEHWEQFYGCYSFGYITSKNYDALDGNTTNTFTNHYIWHDQLFFANVSFMYNFEYSENDGYYWIDDYAYGEKIEYIPQDPERVGYTFAGWYTEPECENKWSFDVDTLPETMYADDGKEIYQETKLFAKWTKKLPEEIISQGEETNE